MKCPKIEEFLGSFSVFELIMCEFFEMPHCSYLIIKMGKWGISKNYHVINFKIEKEPKMKFFDFGAFQKIMKTLSRDKILFHMLFEAPRLSWIKKPRCFRIVQQWVFNASVCNESCLSLKLDNLNNCSEISLCWSNVILELIELTSIINKLFYAGNRTLQASEREDISFW